MGPFLTHVLQPQAGDSTDYGIMCIVVIRRQCALFECEKLSNALTSSSQCCCSSSQSVCASLVSRRWSCSSFCSSSNCSRLTAPCSNSLMRPALTASSACKTPHGQPIKIKLDCTSTMHGFGNRFVIVLWPVVASRDTQLPLCTLKPFGMRLLRNKLLLYSKCDRESP